MLGFIKQYLWILDLVTLLLCSFFGAKLVSLYIGQKIAVEAPVEKPVQKTTQTSASKEVPPFSDYEIIVTRNIFDSAEEPSTGDLAETENQVVPAGEPVPTSLSLQILGVLVVGLGEDQRSSATIQTSGGADAYSVGTENGFAPNTKLTKVQPDRIIFLHNGRLEFAAIEEEEGVSIFGPPPSDTTTAEAAPAAPKPPDKTATIKQEGEGKFAIDQREVQSALGNIERLYTEIRAVPNFAGGKVSGMKILSVKQGSLFDKLGLQRGDILEKINGLELDVKKGFDIFAQLKNEKHLTVDLVRQGGKKTFEYDIR